MSIWDVIPWCVACFFLGGWFEAASCVNQLRREREALTAADDGREEKNGH